MEDEEENNEDNENTNEEIKNDEEGGGTVTTVGTIEVGGVDYVVTTRVETTITVESENNVNGVKWGLGFNFQDGLTITLTPDVDDSDQEKAEFLDFFFDSLEDFSFSGNSEAEMLSSMNDFIYEAVLEIEDMTGTIDGHDGFLI